MKVLAHDLHHIHTQQPFSESLVILSLEETDLIILFLHRIKLNSSWTLI